MALPHRFEGFYARFSELSCLLNVILGSSNTGQAILRKYDQVLISCRKDSEHFAKARFSCLYLLPIEIEEAILIQHNGDHPRPADLPSQDQAFLQVHFGTGVVPLLPRHRSEIGEQGTDPLRISDLAGQGQPFLQVGFRLGVAPLRACYFSQAEVQKTDLSTVATLASQGQPSVQAHFSL